MFVHEYRYYLHTRVESGCYLQVQVGFWTGVFCPGFAQARFSFCHRPVVATNFLVKRAIFEVWTIQNLASVSLGHSKTNDPWAKYWVPPTLLHTYVLLSHFWPYRLALTKAPSFLSRSSMRPFRVRLKLSFSLFLSKLHHRHNYLFLSILSHTCFFLKIVILSKVPLLATLS